jgi:hypothetical protein
MWQWSAIVVIACVVLGCSPSEEQIKRELSDFVSKHVACTQDAECTVISPGCPLGCAIPIQKAAANQGERLARELIEDYESGGASCEYECVAVCGAACRANVCTVVLMTEAPCPQ